MIKTLVAEIYEELWNCCKTRNGRNAKRLKSMFGGRLFLAMSGLGRMKFH
jgi:hypothetical protein